MSIFSSENFIQTSHLRLSVIYWNCKLVILEFYWQGKCFLQGFQLTQFHRSDCCKVLNENFTKKSNNLRKKENEKICCWERLKQFIAERAEAPNEILVQQQKVPFFFINKAYHSTLTKAIKSTNKMIKMSLSFITIQTSQELRMLSWSLLLNAMIQV